MNYDAIVIGGGPAGSTAATLLAQRGLQILLLEKSRFPREKLCGEFITPECLEIFERLGVRERMLEAGAQSIRRMTLFAPNGRSLAVPMEWIADGHSHALSLTRARMDTILLARTRETGVEVREGWHVSPRFKFENGLGMIEGKSNGETIERFCASLVIDASGRNGVFSNLTPRAAAGSPESGNSRQFGCKVHLRGVEGLGELGELYFFRDGYGGLTDVEADVKGNRTNLCFLTTEATLRSARGDREMLLALTMQTNPAARERLQNAVIDGEWLGTGPLRYGRHQAPPGVLAIGDAGAFIDPFTGSGILLALSSGELAAQVINQSFAAGIRDAKSILNRYTEFHRANFGLRYRASSALRNLASRPLTRNALVSVLSRHQSLMKLIAQSTRKSAIAD